MVDQVCPEHTHQLLEGRLVQVALQGELTEGFPWRLVGLDLHRVPLHAALVADGTPGHQRRPRETLEVLCRGSIYFLKIIKSKPHHLSASATTSFLGLVAADVFFMQYIHIYI